MGPGGESGQMFSAESVDQPVPPSRHGRRGIYLVSEGEIILPKVGH
jgi:hypothetical protein